MTTEDSKKFIDMAMKVLTPEQQEEYKRVGKYMYNTEIYKIAQTGSKVKSASTEDLIFYATEALKSGCDPKDLTDEELNALISIYGERWYERFDLNENEIRKPVIQVGKKNVISRRELRMLEKEKRKQKRKQKK